MDNDLPHGCDDLVRALHDDEMPLEYVAKFREYLIRRGGGPSYQRISHCPFCGAAFPGSLRDEYFDELDKLGLEPESPDLPLHLRSDAWWRRRAT